MAETETLYLLDPVGSLSIPHGWNPASSDLRVKVLHMVVVPQVFSSSIVDQKNEAQLIDSDSH